MPAISCLPQGKALRANEANRKRFESERVQFEARNLERRQEAEGVAGKLEGQSFVIVRQAGETGQLYGSVTARDLAEAMEAGGFSVNRSQIALNHADQDHRHAQGPHRASPGGRAPTSPPTSRAARTKQPARRAAKT